MEQDLRRIPMFHGLPDDALEAIKKRMKLRHYKKGDIVFPEGAPGNSMYIIDSGQVQVVSESAGEPDAVFAHLGPGSFFGEMALLLGEPRSATVRVAIDAEMWELHKDDLETLLHRHPSIGITISRELSRRLSRTTHQHTEVDEIDLITLVGEQVPLFAERLAAATGEYILVLDLGGLRPEHPTFVDDVAVHQMPVDTPPEVLAEYLSENVDDYGRIVMVITQHETALNRKAAELAEVIVEISPRSTPWVKRFGRDAYWFTDTTWKAVDRAARRVAKKTVGLALSAGNARGLAHIGVLRVLEEADIPIDMIAGTSMGAMVGALYASGHTIDEIEERMANLPKLTGFLSGLWDFQIPPRSGIVKGEKARRFLAEEWYDRKNFNQLDVPMRIIATDLVTGEEVIFESGPVADAVRASISIMGVFQPAFINGRHLIDGGVVNPVPVSVAADKTDIIIASSVIVSLAERAHRKEMLKNDRLPHILGIILGAQEIMEAGIVERRMDRVDVLIQPDIADLGGMEYERWDEFVARGYEAAERAVGDIKRLLTPEKDATQALAEDKIPMMSPRQTVGADGTNARRR